MDAVRRGEKAHSLTNRLDSACITTLPTRQSNRVSGIPLRHFPRGFSTTARNKSQEFPALILVLMVVLGMEGLYMSTEDTHETQYAITGLYLVWHVLKRPWISRAELPKLNDLIKR